MTVDAPEGPGAHSLAACGATVVLVGTGHHRAGSRLEDLPGVDTSLDDLEQVLQEVCGIPGEQIHRAPAKARPTDVVAAVEQAVEESSGPLLLCYLGHGITPAPYDELYLATYHTGREDEVSHAVPFRTVSSLLGRAPGGSVTLLDCCYSGMASLSGGRPHEPFVSAHPTGGYLLASTSGRELSFAPPGNRNTLFTGRLLKLLREGDAAGPLELTLEHAYRFLLRSQPEAHAWPYQRAEGNMSQLVLAPNRAYVAIAPEAEAPAEVRCPFPGMEPFEPFEHRDFFGRELLCRQLADAVRSLTDSRPLALVGASGAGKSSLLNAGLLGRLERNRASPDADGPALWPTLRLPAPGPHPMRALTELWASATGRPEDEVAQLLDEGRFPRPAAGRRACRLLVIDQFEEIFTLCRSEDERARFVRVVCAEPHDAGRKHTADARPRIVLGLRVDYLPQSLTDPRLPELARALDRQLVVRPMDEDSLRAVIERPCAGAGLALEAGLTDRLIQDLHLDHVDEGIGTDATTTLPFLAHALRETWLRRSGTTMTLAGYQATGGIWRSVTTATEKLYQELDEPRRRILRVLLLHMIDVTSEGEAVRRRVDLEEFLRGRDTAERGLITDVYQRLVEDRLITAGEHSQIAHEALLRVWTRLRCWISEYAPLLHAQRRLCDDACGWVRAGREASHLYRDGRLAAALEWADSRMEELEPLEREFLAASIRQQQAEERAKRRQGLRMQQLLAVLAVLLLIATGLTGLTIRQREEAQQERMEAWADLVAVEADRVRRNDVPLAMLLSLTGYRISPTHQARSALLDSSAAPSSTRLVGPAGAAQAVAVHHDGRFTAVGGTDGAIRLWDLTKPGKPKLLRRPLQVSDAEVFTVALSPDGRTLAVGGRDSTVQLWDVTAPRSPRSLGPPLTAPSSTVYEVAFSHDGRTLAAGSADQTVYLWDVTDRRAPELLGPPLDGPEGAVHSVALSEDGRILAAGSADDTVRLWNVTEPSAPEPLGKPLKGPKLDVRAVAFSKDGNTLAAGSNDRTVHLWDVSDPAEPESLGPPLEGPASWVHAVAFSEGRDTLAVADSDGNVRLWNVTERTVTATLPHPGPVTALAFDPDGSALVTGSTDGVTRVWELPGAGLGGPVGLVFTTDFSPHGDVLAVCDVHGTLQLWDVSRPRRPEKFGPPLADTGTLSGTVAFGPNGDILAAGGRDGSVHLWDVSDPARPKLLGPPLAGPGQAVQSVAISPDGRVLAAAGEDEAVHLWDLSEPREPARLPALKGPSSVIYNLAFSPDSRTVAAASADRSVHLWDVTDPGQPTALGQPLAGPAEMLSVDFSPGGGILAAGDRRHTVRLWDVSDPGSPEPLPPLAGPAGDVWWVAFSPTGGHLAAGGSDGTVQLWDAEDLRKPTPRATLTGLDGEVLTVDFSPDGTRLAAGGGPNTAVRLWDLDPERVAEHICAVAGSPLTEMERERYIPGTYDPPCRRRSAPES